MPAPLPDFSATLRRLASGELPPIPTNLPPELRDLLSAILTAIREASQAPAKPGGAQARGP